MKKFKMSENIINAILDYLSTKPFKEVVQLINAIQEDAKLIEESQTEIEAVE